MVNLVTRCVVRFDYDSTFLDAHELQDFFKIEQKVPLQSTRCHLRQFLTFFLSILAIIRRRDVSSDTQFTCEPYQCVGVRVCDVCLQQALSLEQCRQLIDEYEACPSVKQRGVMSVCVCLCVCSKR